MDRGTQSRVVRFILPAVLALAVVAGGSLYLARGVFSSSPAAARTTVNSPGAAAGCDPSAGDCAASPDDIAVAVAPAVVTVPPRQAARAHQATAKATPSARASARSSAHPTAPASAPASTRPSSSAIASAPAGGTAAGQVLALINQARAQAGLPAYSLSSGLGASSGAHNAVMIAGCGLSHQCPGEPSLGQRETNAGVHWTAAGENIGEGGPVADSSSAIAQMATRITQSMLDEQPPNDGHRENILSRTFRFIGITVTRDSHGTVWMTQDFSN